jgi:hypothetical protein
MIWYRLHRVPQAGVTKQGTEHLSFQTTATVKQTQLIYCKNKYSQFPQRYKYRLLLVHYEASHT